MWLRPREFNSLRSPQLTRRAAGRVGIRRGVVGSALPQLSDSLLGGRLTVSRGSLKPASSVRLTPSQPQPVRSAARIPGSDPGDAGSSPAPAAILRGRRPTDQDTALRTQRLEVRILPPVPTHSLPRACRGAESPVPCHGTDRRFKSGHARHFFRRRRLTVQDHRLSIGGCEFDSRRRYQLWVRRSRWPSTCPLSRTATVRFCPDPPASSGFGSVAHAGRAPAF